MRRRALAQWWGELEPCMRWAFVAIEGAWLAQVTVLVALVA